MSEQARVPSSTADLAYGKDESRREDIKDTKDTAAVQTEPTRAGSMEESDKGAPLLDQNRSSAFSGRWHEVQAKFVDEPKDAVREADALVAEVIQTLATGFADQRKGLEDQWSAGSEVSTEGLRQALMQYRSFFQRLLAA